MNLVSIFNILLMCSSRLSYLSRRRKSSSRRSKRTTLKKILARHDEHHPHRDEGAHCDKEIVLRDEGEDEKICMVSSTSQQSRVHHNEIVFRNEDTFITKK